MTARVEDLFEKLVSSVKQTWANVWMFEKLSDHTTNEVRLQPWLACIKGYLHLKKKWIVSVCMKPINLCSTASFIKKISVPSREQCDVNRSIMHTFWQKKRTWQQTMYGITELSWLWVILRGMRWLKSRKHAHRALRTAEWSHQVHQDEGKTCAITQWLQVDVWSNITMLSS